MAKWMCFFWCAYLVVCTNATLRDELESIGDDLVDIESKSLSKDETSDEKASVLIDLLKKELSETDNYAHIDGQFIYATTKKAKDIAATNKGVAKKTEEKETVAKDVSSEKFLKALESRNDDFDTEPLKKRAIVMMTRDMVTREINDALKDGGKGNMCSNTTDTCCDKIRQCEFIARRNLCHIDSRIPNLCPKACKYCKVPMQPLLKCPKTKFGCCWDRSTPKLDKDGKNCPICKDDYQFMCKAFLSDCEKVSKSGEFMRLHCKKSCHFCEDNQEEGDKCADDKKMAFYCPYWKKDLEWCDSQKETMKHFCPVTCGFC